MAYGNGLIGLPPQAVVAQGSAAGLSVMSIVIKEIVKPQACIKAQTQAASKANQASLDGCLSLLVGCKKIQKLRRPNKYINPQK